MPSFISNFEFLKHHDELLFRLAKTAERCNASDPKTSLIKMRQLGEALAQNIAARMGVDYGKSVKQIDLLNELEYSLKLAKNVKDAFIPFVNWATLPIINTSLLINVTP